MKPTLAIMNNNMTISMMSIISIIMAGSMTGTITTTYRRAVAK